MTSTRVALLGCLLLAAVSACGDPAPPVPDELAFPGAGLLLVSVDTLRADRLGCYGYERGTSPAIDALAEEAVLFEDMYSNSPKTASSHMSLLTSLLPTVHKVRNKSARLGLQSPVLARNRLTLAQVLNRAGYWNAAVAGGGNISEDMGFARGFMKRFESQLLDVSNLVDRTLARLDQAAAAGQPPFVFLHTYQVHGPYLPPPGFEARFAPDPSPIVGSRVALYRELPFRKQWSIMNRGPDGNEEQAYWYGKEYFGEEEARYLSDLYDGEIAYTDQELGRLVATLRESGRLDEMIVVVLSDHGEEFLEHGDLEHDQLYREHLHVPCIVRLPGGVLGGTRVSGTASLIDVMPTLLELLEVEGPAIMEGTSLVGAMTSGHTGNDPAVSERVMFPGDYEASLRNDRSSVIFHAAEGRLEAYDLADDPGETRDVYGSSPSSRQAAERLRAVLGQAFHNREVLDAVDAGGTTTVGADELDQLEALGYAGGSDADFTVPSGTPLDSWPSDG